MAPKARLVIVKVLDEGGRKHSADLENPVDLQNQPSGIHVVNLSVGAKTSLEEPKERRTAALMEQVMRMRVLR